MSRLSAPTTALVQLLKALLGLTGYAPAQLQQTAHSTGAPKTLRVAGRIVWELLPPSNAPPGVDAGVFPRAPVFTHIRPTPSPCAGICKTRALSHRASDHSEQPPWPSSPPTRAMPCGAKSGEAAPDAWMLFRANLMRFS